MSDRLATSALLIIFRASVLLAGAVAGAFSGGTAISTLSGSVLGYSLSLLVGLACFRAPLQRPSQQTLVADIADFCRYGMLAAGASVIHLTVPVTIRFIVVGRLASDPAASAGFSMAIDLLQRPFAVLVAAIHSVNYPEVVYQFEHGTDREARDATAQLFDFIICTTVVLLGGLIGFLPDAARLFVPRDIAAPFLAAAPAAATFYFLHVHIQGTLAVIPHLQKSALRLVIVAGCQLLAASAVATVSVIAGLTPGAVLDGAAAATALIIGLASGPTLRAGAAPRPALFAAATLAALLIAALHTLSSEPLPWLLGKIAFALAATAAIAWRGDFLMTARRAKSG